MTWTKIPKLDPGFTKSTGATSTWEERTPTSDRFIKSSVTITEGSWFVVPWFMAEWFIEQLRFESWTKVSKQDDNWKEI